MEQIAYVGEHLLPGKIGHFALILAFCAAILSAISYYFDTTKSGDPHWNKLGKISFLTHGISIFILIGVIFFIMVNKYYEYVYAYEHVSDDLPMKYILSAFWEGQEGSFLVWMTWHICMGFVILWKGGKWESSVLTILSAIQIVFTSFLLGVHIGFGDFTYKLGANPLLLLRDVVAAPIFTNAEYVSLISGTGLNPLLQNYWNVIHPPVMLGGFATTSIPFCFALAGLWTGRHKEWLNPALKWSLFSAFILGTGILMGCAWAYEALTFGGYWAWDPVENGSLIPWLVILAALHTHLVARSTGYSIRPTYIGYILAAVMAFYATFLTRSGILGDTSVHAFTEMGLEWQLVFLVVFFLGLGLWLFFAKYKSIPSKPKEESLYSREFWMFVGSLILLFSGALIISSTSLPVYNTIVSYFDPSYVGKVIQDPIPHYNRYQIWIGIFITLLSASALFLRYNEFNFSRKKFLRHLGIAIGASLLLTFLFTRWLGLYSWQYYTLMFTAMFSIGANVDYIIRILKGKLKLAAAAIAHLGFAIMLVGVLASGINSYHISSNPFVFKEVFEKEDLGKYVLLYKNQPLRTPGHMLTYKSDSLVGFEKIFTINVKRFAEDQETVVEEFDLKPNALYATDFSKVASYNPDARHYLGKDIFAHAQLPKHQHDLEFAKEMEDTLRFNTYNAFVGDTFRSEYSLVEILSLDMQPMNNAIEGQNVDVSIGVNIRVTDIETDSSFLATPALGLRNNMVYNFPEKLEKLNTLVKLDEGFFEQIFTAEDELDYATEVVKQGEVLEFKGMSISIEGFEQDVKEKNYAPMEGDIAVAGLLRFKNEATDTIIKPLYIIRDNRPFSIKAYHPESGIHIRLANINPKTKEFDLKLAKDERTDFGIPLVIAENVPRTDVLIFSAQVLPGINLFWIGSITMLLGVLLALIRKWTSKPS